MACSMEIAIIMMIDAKAMIFGIAKYDVGAKYGNRVRWCDEEVS